jgi:hypothetical protein
VIAATHEGAFDIGWPAELASSYDNVIAVGSMVCDGCFDINSPASSKISVLTPGGGEDYYCFIGASAQVITTNPPHLPGNPAAGYYLGSNAPSFAAPVLSGMAGLALSANPGLTPSQFRDIIEKTADDKGEPGKDDLYGWGRADAYQALLLSLAYGAQSHSATATANNGQRKLLLESDGTLHQAFESGGEIYYRNSTTGGTSWQETIRISSGTEDNTSVCITERSGKVYAVWQKPTDPEEDAPPWSVMYNYSTDGGKHWLDAPASLADDVGAPSAGPQPVIMSTSPSDPFGLMLVFLNGGNGLYESHSGSEPPYTWSTPAAISGTDSDSKSPALAYRVSGSNPYKLVWDDNVSGSKKIYLLSWTGSSWGGLKQVNSGSLTGEERPTISVTASNAVDIAWEGTHNGYEAIIHNRNQSGVYTIFESSILGYSNPTITGHANGIMTLVWQVSNGAIYKVRYNGSSWGSVTSIGSNSSNPSTSIVNPAGGDARVFWTQGSSSPYPLYLASQTLNKTTADSAFDVYREIVLSDTLTDEFLSIRSAEINMLARDGSKQVVGFVRVSDGKDFALKFFAFTVVE